MRNTSGISMLVGVHAEITYDLFFLVCFYYLFICLFILTKRKILIPCSVMHWLYPHPQKNGCHSLGRERFIVKYNPERDDERFVFSNYEGYCFSLFHRHGKKWWTITGSQGRALWGDWSMAAGAICMDIFKKDQIDSGSLKRYIRHQSVNQSIS